MSGDKQQDPSNSGTEFPDLKLDENQRQTMLTLAREAIRDYLLEGAFRQRTIEDPALLAKADVFVTLWSTLTGKTEPISDSNEKLRGCVGRLQSMLPLYITVQESAVSAAAKDPRFPPVTLAELETIKIEIAILSKFQKVNEIQDIIIGKHGLMIEGLGKRGLLLPKVAKRLGLSCQEFYWAICNKAGVPYHCWPERADLFMFTTVDFYEK